MICVACGHENREGANFCRRCGTALAAVCPHCGSFVEAEDPFCDGCGQALKPAAVRAPARSPEPVAGSMASSDAAGSGSSGRSSSGSLEFSWFSGAMK